MMDNNINIFMTAIQYPCGEGSSCCGPVGQKGEEIDELRNAIEEQFGCAVEVKDIKNIDNLKGQKAVSKLINRLGLGVLPIITLNNEVVSMGTMDMKTITIQLKKE